LLTKPTKVAFEEQLNKPSNSAAFGCWLFRILPYYP